MAGKQFPIGVVIQGKDKSAPAVRGIGKITRKADKAKRSIGGLSKGFGGLGSALKVFATGFAIRKAVGFLTSYAEAADTLGKFARQAKLSVEALQQWRYAAEISGMGTEDFDKGLGKLMKTVGEAQAGTGTLPTLLRKVSPALLEQVKAVKTSDEALQLFITAAEKVEDPMKRAALAAAFFGGRVGQKMALLVETGSEELGRLMGNMKRFGVVSGKEALQAEKWQDKVLDLRYAFGGLKNAIGSELLPVLIPMVEQFTEWMVSNKGEVARKITTAIKGIAKWLAGIDWGKLGDGIGSLFSKADKLLDTIGGIKTALIAIGAMKFASLVLSIGSVGTAFTSLAAGPIGLVLLGLAAIGIGLKTALDDMDDLDARRKGNKVARERMKAEGDRVQREALAKAGFLKPGTTKITGKRDKKLWTGADVSQLFSGLSYGAAIKKGAAGAPESELREIERLRSLPRLHAQPTTGHIASRAELEIMFSNVPAGVEIGTPKASGPNAPAVRTKRTGRRFAPAGG